MKQVLRIGIFSSMLCLGACGSGAVAAIRPQAAKDMSCAEGQIQVRHVRPGASENDAGPYYAEGCGKLWRYVVGCNTGGLCMNPQGTDVRELITRQASFDLTCERQALTIAELNADTFGVNGCGKKASYIVMCRVGSCKAVQNTQAQ
jgi:hypothetical protein